MDKHVFAKKCFMHDGHSQLISNENPEKNENELILSQALASLPSLHRLPLLLWLQGYRQQEIGEQLNVCRTTAGARIRKSIELLQEILEIKNIPVIIASDVWPNGAILCCKKCGRKARISSRECEKYLATGWPKHCKLTMMVQKVPEKHMRIV